MKKGKLITLISSIIFVIAIAVTLIIVFVGNGKDKYKYPDKQPAITTKDEVFIKLGNREITNEDIYNTGILNYGLTTLVDLIDEKFLDITYTQEEFEAHKKKLYASYNGISVDEVTYSEEQIKTVQDQMFVNGYTTTEAIEKAIKLDLIRQKFSKEQFKQYINAYVPTEKNPYFFTDSQMKAAINSLDEHYETVKTLYVVFRSENEAKLLMKKYGIDTNNLVNGWYKTDGTAFNKDEILNIYINMYNDVNNTNITVDDIKSYKQSDLSTISSTIASTVFGNLKDLDKAGTDGILLKDCYISNPAGKKYLTSYYYLAVRLNSNTPITIDQYKDVIKNGTTDEALLAKANAVTEKLIDTALTSSVINAFLYKARVDAGIQIYDERLDFDFDSNFDTSIIYFDKIPCEYELTTKESDKHVATINKGNEEKNVTADELFNEMINRYGTLIAVQYMNFYLFFNPNYSDVYDFENKTELAGYIISYNKNINTIKESLESGAMATNGYSKNYGWENFARDYFGLTDIKEAVMLGEAYDDCVDNYIRSFFTITSPNAELIYDKLMDVYRDGNGTIEDYNNYVAQFDKTTYENTIVYQICKNFTEYFHVKAVQINYLFDGDFDGVADEETDESKHNQAKELISALYYIAQNNPSKIIINDTSSKELKLAAKILEAMKANKYPPISELTSSSVEDRIKVLVQMYNISSIDDEIFGVYKKMNLRLNVTSEATYTDASASEELSLKFKAIWNQVLLGTLKVDNGSYASFPLAEVVNPTTTALSATQITSEAPYKVEGFIENNNITSIVFITSVTNTTWYHYYQKTDSENRTIVVKELMPAVDRLTTFARYYQLSLIDISDLNSEELIEFNNITPISFEVPFVTNTLGVAYDDLYDSDVSDLHLNEVRKAFLEDSTFTFTNPKFKDECLKMIELAYQD
ncbi:MAG: hypothetical protein IKC22_03210 [Bacilli bacterium]|nr:hypothetical protein [Bacilli bacterium]